MRSRSFRASRSFSSAARCFSCATRVCSSSLPSRLVSSSTLIRCSRRLASRAACAASSASRLASSSFALATADSLSSLAVSTTRCISWSRILVASAIFISCSRRLTQRTRMRSPHRPLPTRSLAHFFVLHSANSCSVTQRADRTPRAASAPPGEFSTAFRSLAFWKACACARWTASSEPGGSCACPGVPKVSTASPVNVPR
mmetsp:Transcript_16049/g.50725  ORF Transcript_16049/g.50725 Transcript_16049/m.50725 type:complete len:201 (-) Transcript_16049:242-844(-)